MEKQDSIVDWLCRLESGDSQAAEELWHRYFSRLVALAARRLGPTTRGSYDEEDVAVSVFCSLDRCAKAGRLRRIGDAEELWRLLASMTAQRVIDRYRSDHAQKRGGGVVRGESDLPPGETPGQSFRFDHYFSAEPTPESIVSLDEQFQRRLEELPDDVFRAIAVRKMGGESHRDIADALDLSVRSIERKLALIRAQWRSKLAPMAGDEEASR